MTTTSRLPHIVALLLCALVITSTQQFHKELSNRIALQDRLIQTRQTWNDQIAAMVPMEAEWKKTLPAAATLSDQYRIVQHINAPAFNLSLPETGLTVDKQTPLAYQGQPIGLVRYPLSNQGGSLRLLAPDFATAWQALIALQSRPDIRFTRARIENDKGTPTLLLESFGVLARIETD